MENINNNKDKNSIKKGRGNYFRTPAMLKQASEHLKKVQADKKKRRMEVMETIKQEAKAEAVPRLKEAIVEAEKEVMTREAYQGANEVKKTEMLRDIGLSVIKKIHMLWDLCGASEKTLKLYSQWFVKPLAQIMEQARKSNLDVYEMKYGKKVVMEKREGSLEDWILNKPIKNVTPKLEEGGKDGKDRGGFIGDAKNNHSEGDSEAKKEV